MTDEQRQLCNDIACCIAEEGFCASTLPQSPCVEMGASYKCKDCWLAELKRVFKLEDD